jgi:hypothetical protein
MWDNIGGKIKRLSKFSAWLGIIGSIIGGIVLFVMGSRMQYGGGLFFGYGLAVIIFGSLLSWISAWLTYGFGELIEKATEIEKNTGNGISCKDENIKNIQNKKPVVENVIVKKTDLYENQNLSSKILLTLSEGEKYSLVEKGGKIPYVNDQWVKIKCENGATGWCYLSNLEK